MRSPSPSAPATARTSSRKKPTGEVLAMDRIEEIHRRLPNCHLVMHGSSSVPQELQDVINKYGGKLKQTWGVPVEEIQRGIKHGVRKINVDTDNRLAITGAIRKVFAESPEKFDPRDYLKPARDAMKKCGSHDAFGQAGHARDYFNPAGRDGPPVQGTAGYRLIPSQFHDNQRPDNFTIFWPSALRGSPMMKTLGQFREEAVFLRESSGSTNIEKSLLKALKVLKLFNIPHYSAR